MLQECHKNMERLISKKNELASKEIFKIGVANINREEMGRILSKLAKDTKVAKLQHLV